MKIKVTKAFEVNWYKVGEEYRVKDFDKYRPHGVQVYRDLEGVNPDVIMDGHYEII
jgi:hypothetical protein